jgi:hypothetical protein
MIASSVAFDSDRSEPERWFRQLAVVSSGEPVFAKNLL